MNVERPETVLDAALSPTDRAAFDAFVRASPFAAVQQSPAWAENAPRSRRQGFLHFLCREGGDVIGAAVVRSSRLGPFARLATVQRGPLVHDPERLGIVLGSLKTALKAQGFSTLVAGPRMTGEYRKAATEALAATGFRPLPAEAQSLHTSTGKVELTPAEEAILASFKQRGRRQIRAAAKKGIVVREAASDADLDAYQRVTDAFHARRPDYDHRGQPDVRRQAAIVAANGGAILVAEREGEVVGGHAFVIQGAQALWLSMATSDDDPAVPRSYLLLWEGMRLARAKGCIAYDLAGLSDDDGDDGAAGRDQFKTAFAPRVEQLVPAHVAALRPLRHALFFEARQIYRRFAR